MTLATVIDVETCGLLPTDAIVEIAAIRVNLDTGEFFPPFSTLVHTPTVPAAASAIHHLTASDLANAPLPAIAKAWLLDYIHGSEFVCAHNAAFDSQYLPEVTLPWVCTYRTAQHLLPDAPAFSNQVLRYHLNLRPVIPLNLHPHRALYDAITTSHLLLHLHRLGKDLMALSNTPVLLGKITFGKHANTPFADLPTDYLRWLSTIEGKSPDFYYTVKHHLDVKAQRLMRAVG